MWLLFVFFLMYIDSMEPNREFGGWGSTCALEIKECADFRAKLYKLIIKQVYIYHERCVRITWSMK